MLNRVSRTAVAALTLLALAPALPASPPNERDAERFFESARDLFFAGPLWFRNALSNPAARMQRSSLFALDRAGERTIMEAGYVGTLSLADNYPLFSNEVPYFRSSSSVAPISPSAPTANQTWDGGTSGNGSAWLTLTNWAGDAAFAGSTSVTTNTDIASIPSTGTNPPIGINGSTAPNLYLGAIDFSSASRLIGDSANGNLTLTLNGATVNAIPNVIVRNSGAGTLSLVPQIGANTGQMSIALGNTTDNIIKIDGTGGITISAVIKNGTGSHLTLDGTGSGTLLLTGANTYTGGTTIAATELILGATGSLSSSGTIRLGGTAANSPSAGFLFGANGGVTMANPLIVQASSSGTEGTRYLLSLATNGNTNTWSGNITLNTDVVVQSAAVGSTVANGPGVFLFQGGAIDVLDNAFIVNSNLRGNNADTYSIQGTVIVNEVLGSSLMTGGSVLKEGSGTLILQGTNNTYTGTDASALNSSGTRIGGGILGIYGDGSLALAPTNGSDNIFFVAPPTSTNLDSIGPTLRAETAGITLAPTRNINIANGITARFDSNGNTFTIAGTVNGGGNLTKVGPGTLALVGTNTYTGTTTVSAGTLNAAATGALGGTSDVTVNNGGTLMLSNPQVTDRVRNEAPISLSGTIGRGADTITEGTGAVRTNPLTVTGTSTVGLGALTLTSNATLDFNLLNTTGVATFTFAGFNPGTFTLNVMNWSSTNANFFTQTSGIDGTDNRLIFAGVLPPDVAAITFNGLPAGIIALEEGFYEVVPIPEASTWISAGLAVVVVVFAMRKRFRGRRSEV